MNMSALTLAVVMAAAAVPHPDLAGMTPAVAAPLEAAKQRAEAGEPDAWGDLASRYLAHEFYEAARASLERAVAQDPEDARWWHLSGYLAAQERRHEEAVAAFRRVLALTEDAGLRTAATLRQAEALIAMGRTDEAADLYRAVADGTVDDAGRAAARAGLGRAAMAAGRHEDAVAHLEAALAAEPAADRLHHLAAQSLRALGRRDAARDHAARAGTRPLPIPDPLVDGLADLAKNPATYIEAARYALRYDRHEGALNAAEIALRADPDSEEAATLADQARAGLAQTRATDGPEADPTRLEAMYRQGLTHLHQGDCAAAMAVIEEASQAAPGEGTLLDALARIYATCPAADAQRRSQALTIARQVYQARPGPAFAETLAMALAANGQFEEAVTIQTRLLDWAREQPAAPSERIEAALVRYREGQGPTRAWPEDAPVFGFLH